MALLFWKRAEPSDTDVSHEPALEVNEQHPLPAGLYWTHADGTSYEETSPAHPLPMQVLGSVSVFGRLVNIGPLLIPGIGAAAAYTANDQMGAVFRITGVPVLGSIADCRFHDLDDEGIDKEIWLFSGEPTLAADNAAFSLSDTDLLNVVGVFVFSTWRDAVNNQLGLTSNTPASYSAPAGILYGAVKTLGADNIAAGSEPRLSLVIERYGE